MSVVGLGVLAVGSAVASPESPRCPQLVPLAGWRDQVEAAWTAFTSDHPVQAHDLTVALGRDVACLEGPLGRTDAAAMHRVEALDARYAGDEAGAKGAARAAVRLDPEGSAQRADAAPTFAALVETAVGEAPHEEFGTSLAARLYVDGDPSPVRVLGQPAVVQVFTPDGAPIDGAWVAAREALPDWVAFPPFDCRDPVGVEALLAQADRAERAYVELDVPAFEAALQAVGAGLPCLAAPIGAAPAAALHRLEGIRQFTHGAETAALRSFQEAQALDPAYAPSAELLRPGSTLAALWDRAGAAPPSPWRAEQVPAPLTMVVDGLPSTTRPAALPSIVQLGAPGGHVLWTRYVPPGASLPDLGEYADAAAAHQIGELPPALLVYREIGEGQRARSRRLGLALGGMALLTVSSGFYIVNADAVTEFEDPDTLPSRLPGLQDAANVSATMSSLLFLGGTGLVVGALLR